MLVTAPQQAAECTITATEGFLRQALANTVIRGADPAIEDHSAITMSPTIKREALVYVTAFLYTEVLRSVQGLNIDYDQLGADLYLASNQLDVAFTQPALIEHQDTLTLAAVRHGARYISAWNHPSGTRYKFDDNPLDYA